MTPSECVALCRLVQAACPQQAIDPHTPDAWRPLLADLRFADAQQAVAECAKRSAFVAPAEIRAEVRRIRTRRIEAAVSEPPREVADDPAAYLRWLRADRRAIADGRPEPAEDRGLVRDGKRLRALVAGATPKAAE